MVIGNVKSYRGYPDQDIVRDELQKLVRKGGKLINFHKVKSHNENTDPKNELANILANKGRSKPENPSKMKINSEIGSQTIKTGNSYLFGSIQKWIKQQKIDANNAALRVSLNLERSTRCILKSRKKYPMGHRRR